jgi:hypothetical protein
MIPHRFENCGYAPVRNDFAKDGLWKVNGARQVIYALSSLSVRDQLAAAARVRERAGETVLKLADVVSLVSKVSDLPSAYLRRPAVPCADAFFESGGGGAEVCGIETTDSTDSTAPPAPEQSTDAATPISEKPPNRRRFSPPERPLLAQERVEAAEGAGCEFHLEEPTGFAWIYAAGVNPADPDLKLAEEAIEADRAGVEEFLRWRQARRGPKP